MVNKIFEPVQETSPTILDETVVEPLIEAERVPCDWIIKPAEGDTIEAYNPRTQYTFTGTIAEFNALMRGD